MGKTVYLLGAGFSKSVGAPLQSEIISSIFSISCKSLEYLTYKDLFFKFRKEFAKLLTEIFYIDRSKFGDFTLEDLYTSIDRCIIDNVSLRKINKKELIDIRQKINALIIMLMDYKLQYLLSNDHIKKFSEYLVNIRKVGFHLDQESDPFTIISTNWDIIFENAIIDAIRNIDPLGGDVDYCFYVHSYNEYELGKKIRSGLYLRGQGKYNIKVLKLHGSMNWLQCQRCQRVYITYFNKIAKNEFLKKPLCRYCNENFNEAEGSYLTSALIMPTFLKDLNNFQLKLSWQIAGIELQEASKIVFMGYSFPLADFELRQLLARSVRSNAEIDVVLHQNDHPIWHHPINDYLPEHRYRSFFGKRKINFYFDGVESYIDQICG